MADQNTSWLSTATTSSTASSSASLTAWSHIVGDRRVEVRSSTRADGDFHLDRLIDPATAAEFDADRRRFVDLPWTMVAEEHGVDVVRVDNPGAGDGEVGDAIVTNCLDAVLGCWAADCAPVVLVGANRALGVVHAGWRGLAAGAIDVAAATLAEPVVHAILGPCIGPCCYEFGDAELELVARGVHAEPADLAVRRGDGSIALDVPGAVRQAVNAFGAEFHRIGDCTGCRYDGFSHRVRADPERHVVAAWQHAIATEHGNELARDGLRSADES